MTYTLEFDGFDMEYTAGAGPTTDEVTITLNGHALVTIPCGYQALLSSPISSTCDPGVLGNYYGSTWRHFGPIDITSLVTAGNNTLVFSELSPHSSGLANVVVKQNGQTIFGPAQPSNLANLAACVVPNGGCPSGCQCYSFNGPGTTSFTFPGVAQPLADFNLTPLTPTVGQTVSFQAAASGGTPSYSYAWNFGDGTSGSGAATSHAYQVAGVYNITLTVTDSASQSVSVTHQITVGATFTLSIMSTPSPVSFQINGTLTATPFSETLVTGIYTVVMPTSIVVGGVTYSFSSWSDGGLSATRSVDLRQATSLQALYIGQGLTHTLTISSTPSGMNFSLNSQSQVTPYSQQLSEAIYTVVMPGSITVAGVAYNFQAWNDGSTSPTRIVSLLTDISLTATYVQSAIDHTLTVTTTAAGITFTINGTSQTTPYSQSLAAGTYTIALPATITLSGILYSFKQWSDGSTVPTRTINLVADLSLSAVYTSPSGGGVLTTAEIAAVVAGVSVIGAVGVYFTIRGKGKGASRAKPSRGPR